MLLEVDDQAAARMIAKRLLAHALSNESDPTLSLAAIREILNRIDGKSAEFITHDMQIVKRILFTSLDGKAMDPFACSESENGHASEIRTIEAGDLGEHPYGDRAREAAGPGDSDRAQDRGRVEEGEEA